jgi:alpha-L-rhamnosidase
MTAKLPLTLFLILVSAIVNPIESAPHNLKAIPGKNKLGLQLNQFTFSWNAIYQTAYRVLVARDLPKLKAGVGDLWDSGKVESPQSSAIRYAGKLLAKDKTAHWKVRCWNTPNQAEIDRVKTV